MMGGLGRPRVHGAVSGRRGRESRSRPATPPTSRSHELSPGSVLRTRRLHQAATARAAHQLSDRAGDRGRQHLQARHALLRAARGHLPGRAGPGAADLDGLLRHRPGADRGRRGRAVRRRARISWPRALAPFEVHLVSLGKAGTAERDATERLYHELRRSGIEVLYDDRDAGPGEKFADAELLGLSRARDHRPALAGIRRGRGADPSRPRVGPRAGAGRDVAPGEVGGDDEPLAAASEAVRTLEALWQGLP